MAPPAVTKRKPLTKMLLLGFLILNMQFAFSIVAGQHSKSTNWGKINLKDDFDVPEDFDFSQMTFKKVRSPFSEQHDEVDDTLEDGHETDIRYTYDEDDKFGPPNWREFFEKCGGNRQSPMDLSACENATKMARLKLTELNGRPIEVSMTNNGHSIQYTMKYEDDKVPLLSGGPLKSTYQFEQLHFHWGLNNSEGSEHTINKRRSAMEMHLLFRNVRYSDTAEATNFRDGLAVIGFLFEVTGTDSQIFLKNLDQLREVGSTVTIRGVSSGFRMKDMVKSLQQDFIAYQGSLTTPPCAEAVSWLVARNPMKISKNDMTAFRKIYSYDELLMAPNYRPIQPRNKRFCLNF